MRDFLTTKSGVKMGIYYEKPLKNLVESKDAILIQSAMLQNSKMKFSGFSNKELFESVNFFKIFRK